MKINRGESIGIIGSSGSGKTTLIDILLGLLEPNSGKIMINDHPSSKSHGFMEKSYSLYPSGITHDQRKSCF